MQHDVCHAYSFLLTMTDNNDEISKTITTGSTRDGKILDDDCTKEKSRPRRSVDWRSPFCAADHLPASDKTLLDSAVQEKGVQIPRDGWYGFCFELEEKSDAIMKGNFSLYLQSKDQTKTSLLLPLSHNDRNAESKTRLISKQAGKIIFLTESSRALVVHRDDRTKQMKTQVPNDSKEHELVRWCLVAARATGDTPFSGLQDSQSAMNEESACKIVRAGTMSESHLLCSTCARSFTSVHAILCHAREAHKPESHSTIWSKPLHVAFQDDSVVVVEKPQGMAVMGASPSLCRSDLLMPFKGKGSPDDLSKPRPVHRLDAATGGLLVVAKTRTAEVGLKQSFADRTCRKRYKALLVGKLEPSTGECRVPMGGKEAHTKYEVNKYVRSADPLAKDGWITVVDLYPITGRRHQLRKHMKALRHPIWGDVRYGQFSVPRSIDSEHPYSRLCLWAIEINFPHPVTRDATAIVMNDPAWLDQVISRQEYEWSKQGRT
jgi:23S rRNA pseudouridine1911/1915/1917 synthase